MSIAATDITCRLSGGASNASAASSLGGAKSATSAPPRLFDDVTGPQSAAGLVEYRCVYVQNDHASLALTGAKAWIPSNTPNTNTIVEIGVGTSAQGGTEQSVVNESSAPIGITFAPAATLAAAVNLGDLPPGGSRAVWMRRTVTAGAPAIASDPITLRATGDTL